MTQWTYLNGKFVPHEAALVHVEDRGFTFADGIYDFVLVHRGRLVNVEAHLDRVAYSLGELEIAWPMARTELQGVLAEAAARNGIEDGHVYLQITRGVAPRLHPFPRPEPTPTIVIVARPAPFPTLDEARKGWRVVTTPDQRWKRCDIKSVALLPNILARQKAVRAGADEAWMFDEDGNVTEGVACNAWIITDAAELVTRHLDNAILSGITRRMLRGVAAEAGVRLVERAFSVAEARRAREAFLTNTPYLVKPVVRIDDATIGDGAAGPVTLRLIDAYRAFIEAQCG